ncbi:MAG TPA: hypothetical protein O0X01_00835 [Methanocorpusculum sp.]|nr:hypothetical protein [Methanocorpusculum sp.]
MTIDDIEKADNLSNIAKQVPYLFLSSDCSPDFEKHCKNVCEPLGELEFPLLTEYRKKMVSAIISYLNK